MRRDRVALVIDGAAGRRWPRRLAVSVLALIVLFFAGGGWFFSSLIRSDALMVEDPEPDYVHAVTGVSAESITFELPSDPADDLLSDEVLGVRWPDGYGLSGAVVSRSTGAIGKQFTLVTGEPPVPGVMVALEGRATPPDPATAGIEYAAITYTTALGDIDAWLTPGSASRWAIFVHGRGASPHEGIRALPAFSARDIPVMLIEYRNDPGAPEANGRLATFGIDEWEDLEAAVRYALDHGAREIVLIGYSMGGAITLSFVHNSELADAVVGIVLDSPALELGAMVDGRAADTNLPLLPIRVPGVLVATAKWMAGIRFGANWGAMDYLDDRIDDLDVPILVFHGVEDDDVPIALSRELADRRPDIVELLETREARHVRSWNVDPQRYEAALGEFLDGLPSG